MAKTVKICLFCIIIPLFMIVITIIYVHTADGIIMLDNSSVEYINVNENDYYLVDQTTVNKGYFDEATYHRLTQTINYDYDCIEKIKTFNKASFEFFTKYARITINSDNDIYCNFSVFKQQDYDQLGNCFYVKNDFKLPEISAENISKLEIFVYDETDESKYIPLLTYSNYDEIDHFLSNYHEYVSKYTSEKTGAFECYIYYKNYYFEEQLYEYDFELLLSQ